MISRINIWKIVNDHIKTLRNINSVSEGISRPDLLLFFIFPGIMSAILTYKEIRINNKITILITAVSILGGFLFNLLAVIYGLMDKLKTDAADNELKSRFVKEIHVNISFNIFLSFLLILLLIMYSYQAESVCFSIFDYIFTGTLYFLLILFLLTMLMILNRIYIIMKKENS